MKFIVPCLLTCTLLAISAITPVVAQSVCYSDGQALPVQLLERFTSADCAACWSERTTTIAPPDAMVLDWVVPGIQGDQAALSAVVSAESILRLQALGKHAPSTTQAVFTPVTRDPALGTSTLRVARGVVLSGYVGASIELKPAPRTPLLQQLTAWVALVEILPAGLEGSPVERNLVRNVFQSTWRLDQKRSKKEVRHWFDQRSMSVVESANPERLQVIGWLADSKNRILAAGQSKCIAVP